VEGAAKMEIQPIAEHNYAEVARIYQEGIDTGVATFETTVPAWQDWSVAHLENGRIVAIDGGKIVGWAALSPVSSRCVYGGVAEVSVYVDAASRGKGVGKYLLNKLIEISEANNIWTLQSGIFRANAGSIALHEKCGFRIIGYRERIGKLGDVWKDNVLLERRSTVVGVI